MTDEAVTSQGQRRYSPGEDHDLSTFMPLGSATGLGATILEGAPEAWVRLDFGGEGMTSGVFAGSAGKIEYRFPSTEYATILEGEVTLTDGNGEARTYGPGDSYFIREGEQVTWEVTGDRFVKSFFNYSESRRG